MLKGADVKAGTDSIWAKKHDLVRMFHLFPQLEWAGFGRPFQFSMALLFLQVNTHPTQHNDANSMMRITYDMGPAFQSVKLKAPESDLTL